MQLTCRLLLLSAWTICGLCCTFARCDGAGPNLETTEGTGSPVAQADAVRSVPFQRLSGNTSEVIREVVTKPSFYRRMPTQQIECDPDMLKFLVRRPEVMVNIWDLMGITKVSAKRTSPTAFVATDGAGTACRCNLIYGDDHLHVYFGAGDYTGTMTPRAISGRCVCILRTQPENTTRDHRVTGTMDVFLKVDNLGADLLTRTLGPFVGKTADYNFVETAKFIGQISQVCKTNPEIANGLVEQLDKIDPATRQEFAAVIAKSTLLHLEGIEPSQPVMLPNATSSITAPKSASTMSDGLSFDSAEVDEQQFTSTITPAQSLSPAPVPTNESTAGTSSRKMSNSAAARDDAMEGRTSLEASTNPSRQGNTRTAADPSRSRIAPRKNQIFLRR